MHSRVFFYTGPSMNPLLKAGDLLEVTPYEGRLPSRGDVVVFRPGGRDAFVTHRVVSVHGLSVRTRGDNNSLADPWPLSAGEIAGRVTHRVRGEGRSVVAGGPRGAAVAGCLHAARTLDGLFRLLFAGAYHGASRAFGGLLSPTLNFQVVSVKRPGGMERMLVLRGRVIGRLLPGARSWRIRRPFRLLVDEGSLPSGTKRRRTEV